MGAARKTKTKPRAAPTPRASDEAEALRRARILKVVLQLAAEGGYDAVQLREVSARSGVAMRTIYKYYGSRSELLGLALGAWQDQLVAEATARTAGATFVDRMISRYKYMFDAFRKRSKVFDALSGLQREGGVPSFGNTTGLACDPEFDGVDPAFHADFVFIVGSVFVSTLHFCIYGRRPFNEGWILIERTIRRMAITHKASLSPKRRSTRRS